MQSFKERVKLLLLKEKGISIDKMQYMQMPKSKKNYNTDMVIGNVNLVEGRYKTKSEADVVVNQFLTTPLP